MYQQNQNMQYPQNMQNMQMQQQPQQPVVPFDIVIDHQFVKQIPQAPQTDAVQYLDVNTIYQMHACLINVIQSRATENAVRAMLFNYFSQNGFMNHHYAELLSMACEYYYAFNRTKGITIDTAAGDVAALHLPTVANMNPQVQQVLGKDGVDKLNDLVYQRNRIRTEIAQAFGQGQQQQQQQYPNQMAGRPMGGGQSGYPVNTGNGHPPSHFQSNQNMMPNQNRQQTNASSMVRNGPTGTASTTSSAGPSRFDNHSPAAKPKPAVSTSLDTTQQQKQPANARQGDSDMNVVDDITRNIGHKLAVGEVQDLHNENIGDVLFKSAKYKPLVARHEEIIVTDDGYTVIDKGTSPVQYKDHETNPEMIRISRSHRVGPKVVADPRWPQMTVASVMDKETTKEEVEELKADDSIIVKEPIGARTLMDARFKTLEYLKKKGVKNLDQRVLESYPIIATSLECKEGDKEILEELFEESDLTGFVDALRDYADKLTPFVYYHIADVVTAVVQRRIKCGVGRNIVFDNILDDYDDILDVLAKSLETTAIDRFKRHARMAIQLTLNYDIKDDSIQFLEFNSLTMLPWSSSAIQLYMKGDSGMLSENTSEEFHAACLKLLDRTHRKGEAVSRRFIVTADNVWLELHLGDMGNKTLILSKPNDIR